MSTADGRRAAPRPPRAPTAGRPLPFWSLQLAEFLSAVVLVDVSVHVRGGGSLVAAAALFALLAALARGPLGLLRLCPQRLHVALLVGVAALVAASPVVPTLRPDLEGFIVLEFAAVGLIRVATLTRTSDAPGSGVRSRRDRTVIDTTASVVGPGGSRPPGDPPAPPNAGGARQAGRAAGAAAASGRRLVTTHGPTVEAHLKRSIQTAGRWVGRVTSPSPERPPPRD